MVTPSPTPSNPKLVFRKEVLARVRVSYPALWTWMRDGKFPLPVELVGSGQSDHVAWIEAEIDEWFATRPRRVPKGAKLAEVA